MKPSMSGMFGLTVGAFFFVLYAGEKETRSLPTFLDTLNKGREVSLADADFSQPVIPAAASLAVITDTVPAVASTAPKQEAGVVPSRFKIQILAGTQEQQVRNEKSVLAAKVGDLPLTVSFESPYYKLFAGDFAQHSEAETWCAQLKDMGYKDAWIVRIASQKQR
jgi:hypothetical protein